MLNFDIPPNIFEGGGGDTKTYFRENKGYRKKVELPHIWAFDGYTGTYGTVPNNVILIK